MTSSHLQSLLAASNILMTLVFASVFACGGETMLIIPRHASSCNSLFPQQPGRVQLWAAVAACDS